METLIVFRHGESELNLRTHLTGEAAEQAFTAGVPPGIDAIANLTEAGRDQARQLRDNLAHIAIDACLCSPALRARQTADIVFEGRGIDYEIQDNLIERNCGLFHFIPDEVAARLKKEQPELIENGHSALHRRHKDGETIFEVAERLIPVVDYANETYPNSTVAFSAHAFVLVALRALVGRFDDERLAQPLVPHPPVDIKALQRANWTSLCQADIYTRRSPFDGTVAPYMTHFQSVGIAPRPFGTGWLELPD